MALYRFLFAPALLIAAVLHGAPGRAPATARAAHVESARPASAAPIPALARMPDAARPRPVPAVVR
jgi:hypothetical protein